jgi:hypothetical protein
MYIQGGVELIFDLSKFDYTQELTGQLKREHSRQVAELVNSGNKDNDKIKTVKLFHGTSLHYFNDILLGGLQRRNITQKSNFEDKIKSNENLVYLTSKWHYWYAYKAVETLNNKNENNMNVPCYIECEVPVQDLVIDEDFFHSKYIETKIKNCVKRHEQYLELKYDECLSQYGTVAHIGDISRENVVSITILAGTKTFINNFINPKSQYQKDLIKWGSGKGKGHLKFMDLLELEDQKYDLTFQLQDIPIGYTVRDILLDKENDRYRLYFNK